MSETREREMYLKNRMLEFLFSANPEVVARARKELLEAGRLTE